MLRLSKFYKRIIGLACLVCFMSLLIPAGAFADTTQKEEISIKKYYPDTENTDKYFEYYIVEDAYIEDYHGLFITNLSEGFGKELIVPGKLDGVEIEDVFLSEVHAVEEVKLADNIETFTCAFSSKNPDGTDGQYMNYWNVYIRDYESNYEYQKALEAVSPQCSIKKLTVGKNFLPEYFSSDIDMSHHYSNGYAYNLMWVYEYKAAWETVPMTNLEEIAGPKDALFFSVHDNVVYSKDGQLLYVPEKVKQNMSTFVVPKECKIISSGVFKGAEKLKSVDLGDSVVTVEPLAFAECAQLTEVRLGNSLEEIGIAAFQNCPISGELTLPKTLKVIEDSAFAGTKIESVVFAQDSQPEIEGHVFKGCDQLKSVSLPENMTKIPQGLFEECTALEKVNIPASVESIESRAFYNCKALAEIILPKGLKKIKTAAFCNCVGLTNIKLRKELKTIGDSAFAGCAGLTQLKIPNKVKKISNRAFALCENLQTITFNKKLTEIGMEAFESCSNIKEVTIPSKVAEVKERAFNTCTKLEKVVVKGKKTMFGEDSLGEAENLVIYGKKKSVAQTIAKVNKIDFKILKKL